MRYTEDEARTLAKFDAVNLGMDMNPYSVKNPRLTHLRETYTQVFEAELAKIAQESNQLQTL
jgi:hypothetical protein